MRALVLVMVTALAGNPLVQGSLCRCSQAEPESACCCGDSCTGKCCCAGKSEGESGGQADGGCICKDSGPRAAERPAPDLPAVLVATVAALPGARPAAEWRPASTRQGPAPPPEFRAPLLL